MKVAVVGSRGVSPAHYDTLCRTLPIGVSTIISGGAKGADALAKRYAVENGLFYEEYLPEYERFGRSAPIERNRQIVDRADYVIVMWDGKSHGSAFVVKYCIDSGTPVRVLICHS